MKYYIDQKFFAIKDRLSVFDENGEKLYYAEGRFFELVKKIKFLDMQGNLIYNVNQKFGRIFERINLLSGEENPYYIKQQMTFFKYRCKLVDTSDKSTALLIRSNFWKLKYNIMDAKTKEVVATINKKLLTFKDKYCLEILENNTLDDKILIATALAIDIIYSSNRRDQNN